MRELRFKALDYLKDKKAVFELLQNIVRCSCTCGREPYVIWPEGHQYDCHYRSLSEGDIIANMPVKTAAEW